MLENDQTRLTGARYTVVRLIESQIVNIKIDPNWREVYL
jgi:hypothetical protein